MPFPTTQILDSGQGADENPIAGNWTNDALNEGANNQLRRLSNNFAAVTLDTSCEAFWNPRGFDDNIEFYFTVVTNPGAGQRFEGGFIKSPGTANISGYQFQFTDNSGTSQIVRHDVGGFLTLATTSTLTYTIGDVLGARIFGNGGGILEMFKNGQVVLTAVDSTYAGNFYLYLGIRSTVGRVNNFGGGNIGGDIDRHLDRGLFRGIERGIS